MKQAVIYKRSRIEIEESILKLEKKIQEYRVNYERLSQFGKYCMESNIKDLEKEKELLEATNDEWLYLFKGRVVNDVIPACMKF